MAGTEGSGMGNERVAVIGAGALGEAMREQLALLGAARVDAVGEHFWQTLSLVQLQGYDCVVSVLADPESLLQLNQMCLIARVDLVTVAVDDGRVTVECFPFRSSEEQACLECNFPVAAYTRIAERYARTGLRRAPSHPEATQGPATTAHPATAVPEAAAAAVALRGEHSPPARRLVIDAITGARGVAPLERSGACPGCEPFQMTPRIVRTRNRWCARVEGIPGERQHAEQPLRLSDGLITGYECRSCGPLEEAAAYVNRRAGDFDDSIVECPRCGQPAVEVEVRDTFRLGELMERFGSTPVPVKYAVIDTTDGPVCFDLEHDRTL